MKCYSFDLDLDPMTFILKLSLSIVLKMKFLASAVLNLQPEQIHKQTDSLDWN